MTEPNKTDIFDFLTPSQPKGTEEDHLQLTNLEKVYYHLNREGDEYYFRQATEIDLRIILRKISQRECIKKLAQCTKTVTGNINQMITTENRIRATFNNHIFYPEKMLAKMYLLDIMDFPENLRDKEKSIAVSDFERFIKTNKFIKEKKELLSEMGYTYFIHYDPNKLISYVLSDAE